MENQESAKEQASDSRQNISPEDHEKAAAVARTLMRMPPKPIKESKKGGPSQPAQSADPASSAESSELLGEEKPPKEEI